MADIKKKVIVWHEKMSLSGNSPHRSIEKSELLWKTCTTTLRPDANEN